MSEIKSLGDALPEEIERVSKLLPLYAEIGPAGMFALAMMRQSLANATAAIATRDVTAMLSAYEDLKGYTA